MLDMLHLLTVVSLFAGAWLISRGAAYVARKVLAWHDRHTEAAAATVDLRIANVKRRETTVAVIRAAIAYAAFAVAIVLSAAQLTGGLNKLTTLAGASFVIILAGFAIQRVLMDVIAGTMMFVELVHFLDPGPPREGRRALGQNPLHRADEVLAALAVGDEELDRELFQPLRQHADSRDLRVRDLDRLAVERA